MATFAERLASFDVAHPATKKRTSSAKNAKTLRWPHESPSPTQLAEAGFLYRPKPSSPDNVTCFLCQANVDGWEKDDDPVVEHLKLSSHCGWAINVSIEQNSENATYDDGGPTSEKMAEARKMTFDSTWPHESKRGWICKAQKMADAGWYYCPTQESDDFVRCAHCSLSLDGWEPKDNPYDEHQRRSADCPFFAQPAPKPKSSRGKKARTSKASRISIQSNFTTISDSSSVIVPEAENNDSVMVLDNDDTKPVRATKGSKKGAKSKKASTKPRGKAAKAGVEESMQASSFVEPEDDDFEVKIASEEPKPSRSRKRKSEVMQEDTEMTTVGAAQGPQSQPPAKKRTTRTRASSIQPEVAVAVVPTASLPHDGDTSIADQAVMPPPPPPASKKGGKGGRKRGSSTVRKASATSTASMASLRANVPDDETIEAALEADLDRPLTDDEADVEPLPVALPNARRLTRTKPAQRTVPASVAPTRRATRASIIPTEDIQLPDVEPELEHFSEEEQEKHAEQEPEQEPPKQSEVESKPKKAKAGRPPKGSSKRVKRSSAHEETGDPQAPSVAEEIHEQHQEPRTQPRGTKSRQVSQQAPIGKTRASELSQAPSTEYPTLDNNISMLNSSMLGSHMTEDESGHETDASIASQGPKKRGPKKRAGGTKKAKAGKKTGMMSRNIEDIVQPDTIVEVVIEQPAQPAIPVVEETQPLAEELITEEPIAEEPVAEEPVAEVPVAEVPVVEEETVETAAPKKGPKKKTAKSTKAKTAKAKPVVLPSSPPASHMSDVWTDQPLGESTPMHLSTADVPTFNPVEAAQIAPLPHTATPKKWTSPRPQAEQQTPRLVASPQSSDAENQPPSSRPSALRPPLEMHSPSKAQTIRIPLAASTPTASPSRRNISKLQTSMPWTAIDLDKFLLASPNADKENVAEALKEALTSPEKKLTVEEWIYNNASKGEEKLRSECERLVGRFENEGNRALKTLEGIVCAE